LAGKTSTQAVQNFLDPIRQAVSCITTHVVIASGFESVSGRAHVITINDGDPIIFPSNKSVRFSFQMQYRIVQAEGERGPWKVVTAGYNYSVQDRLEKEFFAYHWHRWVKPPFPHLHVCPGSGVNNLRKVHLPTARISVEEILQLLIEQFRVKPIRNDWEKVLKRTKAAFEKYRTWS